MGLEQFHWGMDKWSKWKKTMHLILLMPITEQTWPESSHPDSSSFDSGIIKSVVAAAKLNNCSLCIIC